MFDYEEVQKRRAELTRGPLFAIPEDRMAEVYKRIEERCPGSRQVYDIALKHIPGGAQHMLVNKVPYPITVRRALGSKIWDVDGNEYIDYLAAYGPIILGYREDEVDEAVISQIRDKGFCFSLTQPHQNRLALKLKSLIPCAEMSLFVKTGSDATTQVPGVLM